MNKAFLDRGVVIPSSILGAAVLITALFHPANPLWASKHDSRWRVVEQQFLMQLTIGMKNYPKADVGRSSIFRSITVRDIQFPAATTKAKTLRIDYTLSYLPEGSFNYSCTFPEYPAGCYIGYATYGMQPPPLGAQKAYVSLVDPLSRGLPTTD